VRIINHIRLLIQSKGRNALQFVGQLHALVAIDTCPDYSLMASHIRPEQQALHRMHGNVTRLLRVAGVNDANRFAKKTKKDTRLVNN